MSIPARYENGVFRPLEEVKGAASGEVYRVFSEKELHGLVYGLTELKHDEGVSWYKRPVPLAIAIAALALFLNFWFA